LNDGAQKKSDGPRRGSHSRERRFGKHLPEKYAILDILSINRCGGPEAAHP